MQFCGSGSRIRCFLDPGKVFQILSIFLRASGSGRQNNWIRILDSFGSTTLSVQRVFEERMFSSKRINRYTHSPTLSYTHNEGSVMRGCKAVGRMCVVKKKPA